MNNRPRDAARRRPSPVDRSRRIAYDVLHEVGANDAYANLALQQALRGADLDQRDAGFVTDVVNGTLRYRFTIDAVLGQCVHRTLASLDPRVLDVLRMGAYQLLITDTDAYAAVDTSVNLVAAVVGDAPKGLVNATLRAVSRKSRDEWIEAIVAERRPDAVDELALRHSHPRWVVSSLRDALGSEHGEELADLLAVNNEPPDVTLVARPGLCSVEELIDQGAAPGRWSDYAAIAPAGNVGQFQAVRQRRAGVQDEGSQLVAIALTEAPVDGSDRYWVDLCAGPGGKTALMAGIAAQRGAEVVGVDLHLHRAELVSQAASGSDGFAGVVVGDATTPPLRPGADRVLLDAPCTGIGVMRRRSELRWRRKPADIAELTAVQERLLDAALDLTRVGGVVAYVTCSPHVAETDLVISQVQRKRSDFVLMNAVELFPGVPELGQGPTVRLWPQRHGTDGMFFALMRRT